MLVIIYSLLLAKLYI